MKTILIVIIAIAVTLGFGLVSAVILTPFIGKIGIITISAIGGGFIGYLSAKVIVKYE